MFESSVILEGSKTVCPFKREAFRFESSVILEGSKTRSGHSKMACQFESSVILEGSKTTGISVVTSTRLRVVLF